MQLTSIIIPNYNGLHWLKPCVKSIRRHTRTPYEIIVVDNGSQDGSINFCLAHGVKLVSLPYNRGYPTACNIGLRAACGDALLLLDNDTLMTPNGLENMLRCLYSTDDIGIVGPMTNHASGSQQISEPFTNIDDMAERMNRPDSEKWLETERVVRMCFLFRRELMNEIGVLDERFSPEYFEDDDYCYRARQAGYRLMIAGDSFIFHYGNASFSQEKQEAVQEQILQNRQRFIEKWGIDPGEFV